MGLFDDIFSGENGVAKTLIDLAEKKAIYKRYIDGVYDPITGNDTGGYISDLTISVTPFSKYTTREIDDSNIQKGDLFTYVSPTEVTWRPLLNKDKITDKGREYYIINYKDDDTGEQSASYKLQLRLI